MNPSQAPTATLLQLALERYGSIARLAEALDVARSPLSTALHGHRPASINYWRGVALALDVPLDDLWQYLEGDTRHTQGGGLLAGSIRARA